QRGSRTAADHEAAERDRQASRDAGDATTAIGERPEAVEGSAERLRVGQANDPGGTIANLRQEAEQLQQRLEGLSGAEFDRAYLEAMVKHHQRDIQQFERAAQEADGAQIRAFAEKTLPLLHTHLERSQQLQRQQTTR